MKSKRIVGALAMAAALLVGLAASPPGASAMYIGDGVQPNGTGGWEITDYGVCVSGIQADGAIVIDAAHNASRADCIDHVLGVDRAVGTCSDGVSLTEAACTTALGTWTPTYPSDPNYDTSAECATTNQALRGNNGDTASHYWVSSICIDTATGAGINLDGLDRTAANCTLKGGVRVSACTGAWTYTGAVGDGAPGFCYTTVNLTSDPAYDTAGECPTGTFGFAFTSAQCRHSYGIKGYAVSALAKKDGSGNYAAAGVYVDLSVLTQGQCLFNGASWSTGVTKGGTLDVNTTVTSTIASPVTGTRAGCLECHNSVSQYNTYAERWKEPYLNTGHKNMLRKVTPGVSWAGPDGAVYAQDASGHAIDFLAGTVNVGGVDKPLMYVFGDWMVPTVNAIYDDGAGVAKTDSGGSYSCAACHATGWSNPAAGVCYPDSTKTTSATCLAPNAWVAASGVQGASYTPPEPLASFPGYTSGITGKWDRDGIMCSRCHSSVFSQTVPAPAGTSSHHDTKSNTTAEANTNLCFGCHQSPATTYVAATIGGVTYPANAKILVPTMIPTGANHGQSWGREFNGHVLGNQFLNSPHARFTGTLVPNSLGKYDLVGNVPANYDSHFKGMICRSSATYGSGNVLQTVWKGGAVEEIKTQDDCNLANGQPVGTTGYWQAESQGNCTTCHNVHESLFDPAAQEPLRRECGITCHADKADWNAIKHPMGPGTPIGNGTSATAPCESCHMPKPTEEGFPAHLWRINTDPDYDTFPSLASFYGGSCSLDPTVNTTSALCTTAGGTWTAATKDRRARTAADGAYAAAVWVDLDLACGQCHGGSAGPTATKNGAPYYDKAYLSSLAQGMHSATMLPPTAAHAAPTITNLAVSFTDTSADNNHEAQSTLQVNVNWGDGKVTGGVGGGVFSHTYASAGKYNVIHTVTDVGGRVASELFTVTVAPAAVIKHSIAVTVLTSALAPIPQATVYLKRESASGYIQVKYGYTNASGVATFPNLAELKNYKIVVYKTNVDFDRSLTGKQTKVRSDAIYLDADHTVTVTQGAAGSPPTVVVAP